MAPPRRLGRGHPDASLARARERLLAARGVELRAEPEGRGFRLSGVKRHVAFAVGGPAAGGAGPHR